DERLRGVRTCAIPLFQTLAPDLRIIAPVREWKWTRDEELKYADKHNIQVDVKKENLFSVDQNIFGRSCEAGVLEDPWEEPPSARSEGRRVGKERGRMR